MSNPNPNLGLTCPSEGTFYVCEKAKVRFVGCCTTDPCADGSGECPQQDLRTSGFSSDHYDEIKPQSCVDTDPKKSWYTCQNSSPPFMGCCKTNPCEKDGCPEGDVIAARLSDDPENAQVMIGTAKPISSSSASTSSPTSAPTATGPGQTDSDSGNRLSTGAIAGISIGAAAAVMILLVILAYKCGWRVKKRHEEPGPEMSIPPGPPGLPGYTPRSPGSPPPHRGMIVTPLGSPSLSGAYPYSPSRLGDETPPGVLTPGHHASIVSSETWKRDFNSPVHQSYNSQASGLGFQPQQPQASVELEGHATEKPKIVVEAPAA